MQKRYRNIIPNMDLTIDFQCSLNSSNFFLILLDVLYLLSVHEYLKCVFWLMSTNYVYVWFKFTGHVKDPLEQETWIDKLIWTSNNVWVVSGKVMLCWQKYSNHPLHYATLTMCSHCSVTYRINISSIAPAFYTFLVCCFI